jgi:hypothetical protein
VDIKLWDETCVTEKGLHITAVKQLLLPTDITQETGLGPTHSHVKTYAFQPSTAEADAGGSG